MRMEKPEQESVSAIAARYDVRPENVLVLDVFVEQIVTAVTAEAAAVSELAPLYEGDGIHNQNAFREFEDFVVNILGLLSTFGFKDVEYDISIPSGTSHYFTFYPIDKNGFPKEKQLIILRISDHDRTEGMSPEERHEFRRKQAAENKMTADRYAAKFGKRKNQVWAFKNIVINENEFDSYDDAFDEVERYLREKSGSL